jgi:hypothetical protein
MVRVKMLCSSRPLVFPSVLSLVKSTLSTLVLARLSESTLIPVCGSEIALLLLLLLLLLLCISDSLAPLALGVFALMKLMCLHSSETEPLAKTMALARLLR